MQNEQLTPEPTSVTPLPLRPHLAFDNAVPVIPVDTLVHTAEHPFCSDPSCDCHRDPDLLTPLLEQVSAGILTFAEAARLTSGVPATPPAPPPWKPLEGEIQYWATFALDACATRAAHFATRACAHAFHALSAEQQALSWHARAAAAASVSSASAERVTLVWRDDEQVIEQLGEAAAAWQHAARAVECYRDALTIPGGASPDPALTARVQRALDERLRIATLIGHLLLVQRHELQKQATPIAWPTWLNAEPERTPQGGTR